MSAQLFFFFFTNSAGLIVGVAEEDFLIYRGDTVVRIFTVKDADGNPVPLGSLSGIAFTLQRDLESDPVLTKMIGAGITILDDPAIGQFSLTLSAADTAALTAFYIFSIVLTTAAGQVATSEIGRLQVGRSPLWTYSGDPNLNPKDGVRFLIGDTVYKDQQFTDPEILYALATRPLKYGAAAILCRSLASKFAREADTVDKDIRDSISQRSKAYAVMANTYDNQALLRGAGGKPYAGGIRKTDKIRQIEDCNRVKPQYDLGMDDNLIDPIGPAGNETPV